MAFRIFPNYSKEGPGLYEDDFNKGPVTRFFQVFLRKFWKLITNNLMFVISNIPMLLLSFMITFWFFGAMGFTPESFADAFRQTGIEQNVEAVQTSEEGEPELTVDEELAAMGATYHLIFTICGACLLTGLCLVCLGPAQTGLTYLYRNYTREIATFTWSDFKDSFKMNFKDSLKIMFINIAVTMILLVNILFYHHNSRVDDGIFPTIATVFFTVLLVLFSGINIFVYPMIASLELKVKHVYKNAVLFFIFRFFHSIGIYLLNLLILLGIPLVMLFWGGMIGVMLMFAYYVFIAFSLTHYLNTFFAWQQIDRYIVNRKDGDGKKAEDAEEDYEEDELDVVGDAEPSRA